MERFVLNVNGEEMEVFAEKNKTLLNVLREDLHLTGAKCGCSTGDCGACKVLFDGEAKNSCLIQLGKAEGHEILTIEGVSHGEDLHPVQVAFIECGAVQCGYCTPGMVISAIGLLNKNPNPTRDEIALALENNLCRCTGYVKIIDAIELAAKRMRGEA